MRTVRYIPAGDRPVTSHAHRLPAIAVVAASAVIAADLGLAGPGLAAPAAATSSVDATATATTQPSPEPLEAPADTIETRDTGTTVAEPPDDEPATTLPGEPPADEQTTDDDGVDGADGAEPRPNIAPQVRSSDIDSGSIVLAVLTLIAIGAVSWVLIRRPRRRHLPGPVTTSRARVRPAPQSRPSTTSTEPGDAAATGVRTAPTPAVDTAALDLLIELGEALIDAGDAVSHVESTLRSLGTVYGIDELGVLVLPTALVVSVPGAGDVKTEVSTAGRRPLRLDQIDDLIQLVNAAERGERTTDQGSAELARIRASEPPFGTTLVLTGYVLATVGIALLLRGNWREVILAALLGLVVGQFRQSTRRFGPSYQPFWRLIAAAAVSTAVFATARVVDDLVVFPALASPLITFLPGALLTTAVLELATGQIVAGAARLASGAMQLLLLALGIVAGAQLVGVPGGDIRASGGGIVASVLPWVGVAAFGVGVVWFNGARQSTLLWILVSMYAAYAGQVIGGLFFGASLSAFFGAAAMTPVALLAARQQAGPTPLVTFLPGFWILVPGALGLEGVTRIIGADGGTAGTSAVTTTVISMVGISLGILLGLTLVANDPDRPWAEAHTASADPPPTTR